MSHDTLLHRIVRPVVRRIATTRIRPNHLTALRIAMALAAAAAFAAGRDYLIYVGSGLFVLSALLDRADGELARYTGRFSKMGHRLDLIADFGADALLFMAMGIGAQTGWLGWTAPVLGVVSALGIAALFWNLNKPGTASIRPVRRMIDPDDLMLLVPVLACAAGPAPLLLLAGTITPLAALWLIAGPMRARHVQSGRQLTPRSVPRRSGIR